jgi:regulator of sigma E protease
MFMLLIAPHEAGHLSAAKFFKVRVIEYSIGVGPKLVSFVRKGTMYALRPIPLAGYVRLGGLEPGTFDDPNSFHLKPAYQRILVLLAGPAANFIVASLILGGLAFANLNTDPGKVAAVETGGPAAASGLMVGDSIQTVDGQTVNSPEDIRTVENRALGQPVTLLIRHTTGKMTQVMVQPIHCLTKAEISSGATLPAFCQGVTQDVWLLGLASTPVITPVDALTVTRGDAPTGGLLAPFVVAKDLGKGIYQLFTGQIPGGAFGPNGEVGAIGIAAITAQAAQSGAAAWLGTAALLSVALGIANLLPIPVLDGGRIVVVLLEKIRRRPFDREKEMAFQRAALAVLLTFVVALAYFDIHRILTHQFPGT